MYVDGNLISKTWNDNEKNYAFNDENGDWYKIDENHPIKEDYIKVTGKYIVERYLLDDLWECDRVEHRYNNNNFLIGKMLPIPFSKVTTLNMNDSFIFVTINHPSSWQFTLSPTFKSLANISILLSPFAYIH